MADASYDAIIVGAGNKGLVTAMYLTKYGGMKTALFEIRHEAGGGWSSEEKAAPGFIGNTHSTAHCSFYHDMIWKDFPDFKDKGGELLVPKCSGGMAFIEDDTCLPFYNQEHDPSWEKQAEAIAKFSQKDADNFLNVIKVWDEFLYPEFHKWFWNPPISGKPDPYIQKIREEGPKYGLDPAWIERSLMMIYDELFESIELKCALLRGSYSWWGGPAHIQGSGIPILTITMASGRGTGFIKGGTHGLAHAAQKIVVENGGKIFTKQGVDKIIVENGRAKGIRLLDGSVVEGRVIVSTLSPYTFCFRLLGEENLPSSIVRKIRAMCTYIFSSCFWCHWAFHERPKYKAEAFNSDIAESPFVALGDKDPWSSSKDFWRRKLGREYPGAPIIEAQPLVWDFNATHNPNFAPEGKCAAGNELYTCEPDEFTEKEWVAAEKKAAEFIIDKWGQYAPNMTWDNVIGYNIDTPWDIAYRLPHHEPRGNLILGDVVLSQFGWNRPIPELSGHRIPTIKSLYATGSGWHPFFCAQSAGGYNCYKVIAEDYGLVKPWQEAGREY